MAGSTKQKKLSLKNPSPSPRRRPSRFSDSNGARGDGFVNTTRRNLLAFGFALVALGACSGAMQPTTQLVGTAHKVGIIQGLLLLV